MPGRLERSLERSMGRIAKERGCLWIKLVKSAGIPDRLLVRPDGSVVFVEVKTAKGELRPAQRWWRARLLAIGHDHVTVRTMEEFMRLMP